MSGQYYEGIGRRKESTARVRISNGTGIFTVNDKKAEEYFRRIGDLDSIMTSFKILGYERGTYDITVKVNGGGVTGQTDSVKLGLARAILKLSPEASVPLRKVGLLTRDPRIKERKKPGLKRARKAPTYTKR
jgi:small subunit ribosomal protein S9